MTKFCIRACLCLNCELIWTKFYETSKTHFTSYLFVFLLHFRQNLFIKMLKSRAFNWCKNSYDKVNTYFKISAWNLRFHHFDMHCIFNSKLSYQKDLSTKFERWFLAKHLLNLCDSYIKWKLSLRSFQKYKFYSR